MVGERKKIVKKVTHEEIEAARQAFLNGGKTEGTFSESILSLKDEPQKEEEEIETSPEDEEEVEESTKEEKSQYTPIELEAIDLGWTPKDQFKGDKSRWKDAASWIANTKLHDKLSAYEKKIDALERTNKEISEYLKTDRREKTELTLNELKQKKREAIHAGDVDLVEKIEEQMQVLSEKAVAIPSPQKNPPEVDEFLNRNPWFNKFPEMKTYAIEREQIIRNENPTFSMEKVLSLVERQTLEHFEHTEEKKNVISVEPRRTSIVRSSLPTFDQLDFRVREIVDKFVKKSELDVKFNKKRTKPLTREYFIAQYVKAGTIDKTGKLNVK